MSSIPTIKVKFLYGEGGTGQINENDFDPKRHEKIIESSKSYKLNAKGKGWYDVVDSSGKVLNDKSLREDEAQSFLETLK